MCLWQAMADKTRSTVDPMIGVSDLIRAFEEAHHVLERRSWRGCLGEVVLQKNNYTIGRKICIANRFKTFISEAMKNMHGEPDLAFVEDLVKKNMITSRSSPKVSCAVRWQVI